VSGLGIGFGRGIGPPPTIRAAADVLERPDCDLPPVDLAPLRLATMTFTRRRFMLDTARLAGGAFATGLAAPVGASGAEVAEPLRTLAQAPPDLAGSPLQNADYWRFADWLAPYFDELWDPDRHYYRSGASRNGRIYHNGGLLLTHAIAALSGHEGPCRQDARARTLARQLCDSPPWSEQPQPVEPDPQFHNPGWVESMNTVVAAMDKSIDPKVAEALMYAWKARDALELPDETVALIEDRISRCARGPFYRFPSVRLNQINWHCEMYAHLATVTGDTELLVNDYRQQLERFCAGITRPLTPHGSPNLGPSYRFHYLPHRPPNHPLNLDSAEYANMTCHFVLWYERALRAGMAPLGPDQITLLRAWIEHIVCGYWTHAGYLNWDTGWSFKRWHVGRTWMLARQGLFAIALSPRFQTGPEIGQWAKHMLDGGFRLYERLAREAPDGAGIAPGTLFRIKVNPLGPSVRELFAVRMQADAARAVAVGLGELPSAEPPPLYSFDGDTGRLAVTTPRYSTAIMPVNQHAIPYGGIELARLFDSSQRVVSNIGGRPWASFGVVVRQGSTAVLKSQRPRSAPDPLRPPLELLRSPRGAVRRAHRYPSRPYAGDFGSLVARGRVQSLEAAVEATHRFRAKSIETRWKIVRRRRGRYSVDVLFPSWGRRATVQAVLRHGGRVVLAAPDTPRRRVRMKNVAWFHLAGEETGYVVVPLGHRRGTARIVKPKAQAAAPEPGPTLAVELAQRAKFRRLDFAVAIAPASSPEEAEQIARRLSRSSRRRPAKRRRS
jgi:hypothetical protein